jgi:hypothetical protein
MRVCPSADRRDRARVSLLARRSAPTLVAGALALVYVVTSPSSLDLPAHLLRAKLFGVEGFAVWNNWWYAGHDVPGYSVLFPPLAWLLTPQVAAAIASTATATAFEAIAYRAFGEDAWVGALWFGAATATNLYTGRLSFAVGLLPAVLAVLALQRGRPVTAALLALLSALVSPVAALFAALAAAASVVQPLTRRSVAVGLGIAVAALAPVLALAVAFPEGGSEPFRFSAFWPILLVSAVALWLLPAPQRALRAGVALYAVICVGAFAVPSPLGGNAARLLPLLAGPLAVMVFWRRRGMLLALVALPLIYLPAEAPIRDLSSTTGDASESASYWQPLITFLAHQHGPPFRVEIPFTALHWESYWVAPRFPLARGWERQLDLKDNHLFYDGSLTAAAYDTWLHQLAVRFVAVSDRPVDYSAIQELALIDHGLPYLHLVLRTQHFRVYQVAHPTPIVAGAATLQAIGPDSVTMVAVRTGRALVRVRWSPYWKLSGAPGCVAPAGQFTSISLRRTGPVRLVIGFSLGRIGSRAPRCG